MKGNVIIQIPGELANAAQNQPVASTEQIKDYQKGKSQEVINQENDSRMDSIESSTSTVSSALATEKTTREQQEALLRAELNAKQLEIGAVQTDEKPTQGSANHLTSGAVYSAITDPEKGFVDSEPTAGSEKLITSGGVSKYIAKDSISFIAPEYENGLVRKTGEVDTSTTYGYVAPILLNPYETIVLNMGSATYKAVNSAVLYETDPTGAWVRTIVSGNSTGVSEVVKYQNTTENNLYVGICTKFEHLSYYISKNVKPASSSDFSRLISISYKEIVDYTLKSYAITANGIFGTSTTYKHAVIPVFAGEEYMLTGTAASRYAFVTSDTASSGGDIPLVEGCRIETILSGHVFLTIPEGCSYLIVNAGPGYTTRIYKYSENSENSGVYDLSKEFPTSGVEGGNTYTLELAISTVPGNLRSGGLDIMFIDSVTQRYVQYHLTLNMWSENTLFWQGVTHTMGDTEDVITSSAVKKSLYGEDDAEQTIEVSYTSGKSISTTRELANTLKKDTLYQFSLKFSTGVSQRFNLYLKAADKETNTGFRYDGGTTANSTAVGYDDDRTIRIIIPNAETFYLYFYAAASNVTSTGTVILTIKKVSDVKGLADIVSYNKSAETSAYLRRQMIIKERPYYFDDSWRNAVSYEDTSYLEERIKHIPEGKHFIFNTDSHIDYGAISDPRQLGYFWLQKETEIMQYVRERTGIRTVVSGGDAVGGRDSKYEAAKILSTYCNEKYEAFGKDFIFAVGNHDANYPQWNGSGLVEKDMIISDTEIYNRTVSQLKRYGEAMFDEPLLSAIDTVDMSSAVDSETGLDSFGYTAEELRQELKAWAMMHYYYDDDVQGIRYIVLETGDFSHAMRVCLGPGAHVTLYFQTDFVVSALQSIPENYDVVIVGHQQSFPDDSTTDYSTKHQNASLQLCRIISAYKQKSYLKYFFNKTTSNIKTIGKELYKMLLEDANGFRKYAFFNSKGSGRIIYIGGHFHADDGVLVSFDETTGYLVHEDYSGENVTNDSTFLTLKFDRCTCAGRSSSYIYNHPYSYSYPNEGTGEGEEQRLGTVNEVLFDVVTITPDNKIVCTRFGAGGASRDRIYDIPVIE